MIKVECPSCGETIRFEKQPKLGQLITCSACKTALVVSATHPLTLNWVAADAWAPESPSEYDRRRKSKKHKNRHERNEDENFDDEDDDDDLGPHGKSHHSKRSRNLDDDYDD